jgi:4-methylaminobutanoate oxidase (formaldehyde-forming)
MSEAIDRARIVVIGGGIVGCSIVYHLAEAGERDVLLVEKAALTSGSTCQAMGVVTMFNPSSTMMGYRRYSIELYRRLGVFETVGSLRIASSENQLRELQRTASRTRAIGLDAELVGPAEAGRFLPAMSRDSLFGAVWLPGDGYLDPHGATHGVAAAARAMGVRVRLNTRVTGIELSDRRQVRRVLTTDGPIEAEIIVNAAGMWAPQVAAMVGAWIPSTPVDHQHAALAPVAGHELTRDMPCFRDPDRLVYGRSESGGMLMGGYEANPPARWSDGVPWDHAERSFPPDYERFTPLLQGAALRFPFLADAQVTHLICHPDAMTPDANPLMGPMPGLHGFWVAAGMSLNGFGGAGGIGRTMAAWITTGEPDVDTFAYRAWRFADTYRDPVFAAGLAREAYSYYYFLRYPADQDEAGRPRRLSALHARLQDAGAVFGTKAGWERVDYLRPGEPWRRAGPDQRAWGWAKPPFFERVGDEHRAVRERAGLIDLTSFGKIEVTGPGALTLLQRVAANDIDRPVGSVVYTQLCSRHGGVVADVTVSRQATDRFRVITGAGNVASDLGWLRLNIADGDARTVIRDMTDDLAVLGLWGPLARDVLGAATDDDVSGTALPLRQLRPIRIGPAQVEAARISYAGELGWELYVAPDWAGQAWDRLVEVGADRGLEIIGYRALEGLRLEKGYRYYGTDLTMLETPDEAGMASFVRPDKASFVGRDAILERRASGLRHRLRTVLIGGDDWLPLFGGESVRLDGAVVGRLRSVAFGYTVRRTVGTVYLPPDVGEGTTLEIDVFDGRERGVVAADAVHDPAGDRMKG